MRKIWRAAGAVAASVALVGVAQGASAAAQTAQSVPGCVETETTPFIGLYITWITNNCDTTVSVTPDYANTEPGVFECLTLAPGEEVSHQVPVFSGEFTGLVPC